MWIMTPFGIVSIVRRPSGTFDVADERVFQARSRDRETLVRFTECLADSHPIIHTTKSDYPYRVFITPLRLTAVLAQLVDDTTYTNFKGAAEKRRLRNLYADIWFTIWSAYNQGKRRSRWSEVA